MSWGATESWASRDGVGGSRSPKRDDNIISLPEQAETTPAVDDGMDESETPYKETPIDAGFTQIQIAARILTEQSLQALERLLR